MVITIGLFILAGTHLGTRNGSFGNEVKQERDINNDTWINWSTTTSYALQNNGDLVITEQQDLQNEGAIPSRHIKSCLRFYCWMFIFRMGFFSIMHFKLVIIKIDNLLQIMEK